MSKYLDRAMILIEQNRFDLAEQQLRLALADEPDRAAIHSQLAQCLLFQDRFDEAMSFVQSAIALDPDDSLPYYFMAGIHIQKDEWSQALTSIQVALELNPEDADYYARLSSIYSALNEWKEALTAAASGLEIDPDHSLCHNFYALALRGLGENEGSRAEILNELQRNPENHFTYANMGWQNLHEGKREQAIDDFKESLRLHPNNGWARSGLIEALKGRNFIYRLLLRYFLYVERKGRDYHFVWMVIGVGILFAFRQTDDMIPETRLVVFIIAGLYALFIYMTWAASPIFNLVLRLDPLGREILDEQSKRNSTIVGYVMAVGGLACLAALILGDVRFLYAALPIFLLIIPLAVGLDAKPRSLLWGISFGLLAGLLILAVIELSWVFSDSTYPNAPGILFMIGLFAYTWVAAYLQGKMSS